jgi:ubiquinone/menaquinone biosynthesis C-methylase UbiE
MWPWWIDEMAHAGDEHLDDDYVARYEAKAGFDPLPDIDLLRSRGLDADSLVIDFGAGTGVFALAVAPICRRVIAVDISPSMTSVLRTKVRESGVANVDVVDAGLLSYEHSGEQVDVVYSRNTFHQVPDFWKAIALSRIATIAKPGAMILLRDLVFDFEPSGAEFAIERWMAGAVDDPSVGYTAADFAAHLRLEHSTYSWLFEPMLERTGFVILEKAYWRAAYGSYLCQLQGPGQLNS